MLADRYRAEIREILSIFTEDDAKGKSKRKKISKADLEAKVIGFLHKNPFPNDAKVHAWAEKWAMDYGLDVHKVEAAFYALATKWVKSLDKKSIKTEWLTEEVDNIRGTETEKHVMAAFAGESQARNRYTAFAKSAREEDNEVIARIFEKTADEEKAHGDRFFNFLRGGDSNNMLEVIAKFPAGPSGSIEENLTSAAEGEEGESTSIYPMSRRIAEKEGFKEIARVFGVIGEVEDLHGKRYRFLLGQVENETLFKKPKKVIWHCLNCGYVHEAEEAPGVCPSCEKPHMWFEVLQELFPFKTMD